MIVNDMVNIAIKHGRRFTLLEIQRAKYAFEKLKEGNERFLEQRARQKQEKDVTMIEKSLEQMSNILKKDGAKNTFLEFYAGDVDVNWFLSLDKNFQKQVQDAEAYIVNKIWWFRFDFVRMFMYHVALEGEILYTPPGEILFSPISSRKIKDKNKLIGITVADETMKNIEHAIDVINKANDALQKARNVFLAQREKKRCN